MTESRVVTRDMAERMQLGEWEQPAGMEGDPDLAILQALHALALDRYDGMVDTLAQVRADDDPSLNDDGRLKIAAQIVEPKLAKLAELAEVQIGKVDASIAAVEGEIGAAVRQAQPVDIAVHADIRAHLRTLGGSRAVAAVYAAINARDIQTLQAIATAPAYLSGLSTEHNAHVAYEHVSSALRTHLAPEQCKRLEALRIGKARALQALSALDRQANARIDFKKARQLAEREAARKSRIQE